MTLDDRARASPGCSARTAPARPRCCASWPPSCARRRHRPRCSAATRSDDRRSPRDPPPPRVPAPGTRLLPGLHRPRLRRLRRHPQGDGRPRRARRDEVRRVIDAVGLDRGRRPQDPQAVGRHAPPRGHRPGAARSTRSCSCSTSRPRASTPSSGSGSASVVSEVAADHAVVLSTHQTDDVAALCDRVVVLHEGRIRFDGSSGRRSRRWPTAGSGWPTGPIPTAAAVVATAVRAAAPARHAASRRRAGRADPRGRVPPDGP